MSIEHVLKREGPRKLLALDGGGIRGIISLEILKQIESTLRRLSGNPRLVLADYFDYIAGTSTGAIIGSLLALGKSVAQISTFYEERSREMFAYSGLWHRWRHKFTAKNITERLKAEIGRDITFGDPAIRTLLLLVLRNATTDSPWPITNNPQALYNSRDNASCNLSFPLWQLIRASAAAPTLFPPEVLHVKGQKFVFVDGGITTYNNPAFQLFLMATAAPYRLSWNTGEDELLLVSIGTGSTSIANSNLNPHKMNLLYNAASIPSALIAASLNQQDLLCRIFGRCLAGNVLDRETGDLLDGVSSKGRVAARQPALANHGGPVEKLFTYVRYNADLSAEGLQALGLADIKTPQIQSLDRPDNVPDLKRIGKAVADKYLIDDVFAKFKPANSTP